MHLDQFEKLFILCRCEVHATVLLLVVPLPLTSMLTFRRMGRLFIRCMRRRALLLLLRGVLAAGAPARIP